MMENTCTETGRQIETGGVGLKSVHQLERLRDTVLACLACEGKYLHAWWAAGAADTREGQLHYNHKTVMQQKLASKCALLSPAKPAAGHPCSAAAGGAVCSGCSPMCLSETFSGLPASSGAPARQDDARSITTGTGHAVDHQNGFML